MPFKVNIGATFVRDFKRLQKRFPLIELDLREFQREIEAGDIRGDRITGLPTFFHNYSKTDKNDASPNEIRTMLRDLL